MAIAVPGTGTFGLQGDLIQSQMSEQRQAQLVLQAAQNGTPIPAGIRRPASAGGFSALAQAFQQYDQSQQRTTPSPRPQSRHASSYQNFSVSPYLLTYFMTQLFAFQQLQQGWGSFLGRA